MSHKSEPPQSLNNPVCCQRSHIIIVVVLLPEPPLITQSTLTPPLRESSPGILAEHVQFPDFPKGRAELLDAEGVNNWVDGRVAVSEDDGDVDEELRLAVVWTEERDAVEDVKWEPADSKEEENEGERLGEFQLLAKVAAGVRVAGSDLKGQHQR